MFPIRSFFVSFFFANLLLVALVLAVGFFLVQNEHNKRTTLLTERFQKQLLLSLQGEFQEIWPNISKERIELYSNTHGIRLTVVNTEGRVLGDSEFQAVNMEPHLTEDRPEIVNAMHGKISSDVRLSRTTNIECRFLAAPIVVDGEIVAVVRIAFPLSLFHENRLPIFGGVLPAFLLKLLIIAILVPVLLRWLWYKPLRLLNIAAQRIAEGKLEPSSAIDAPLELAQLSLSLETMRRTVSEQLATITRQREGLQTILLHHPDAIFAMNRAAEVIYCNAAAKRLFRFDAVPEHSLLQKIVRNASIIDWYLQCRRNSQAIGASALPAIERKEVDLFGRKHFLELEFIETGTESKEDAACLVIISDLTEIVQAGKMKTDFVANASHELRTPLAAIRVALDNVSEDIYENKETLEKIIQIVSRHVSRLDALIEDLLALHGVEDETVAVRLDETSVEEQQAWIEELFHSRIEEKRLTFSVVSELGDMRFRVDNKRLGLILQNLLDNAIKYTPVGGRISLTFRGEGMFLVMECRDSGFGISADEQGRVFERFYQGDSSRTGDIRHRGTGLGLAIVKHAVERLRGSIALESRPAQGCVFVVRIPCGQS